MWGPNKDRRLFSDKHWNGPLRWDREAVKDGKSALVFCGSMCDFAEKRSDLEPHQRRLGELIVATPHLTWLMLTKRPENIGDFIHVAGWGKRAVPHNVWWGVTIESQEVLGRWDVLDSETHYHYPPVLFMSVEPMLGPLDLGPVLEAIDCGDEEHTRWTHPPDWVICGGESGPGARILDPEWALGLRDQCVEMGVPFFFKQWGEWGPVWDSKVTETGYTMMRVGREDAGCRLDDKEWREFPVR